MDELLRRQSIGKILVSIDRSHRQILWVMFIGLYCWVAYGWRDSRMASGIRVQSLGFGSQGWILFLYMQSWGKVFPQKMKSQSNHCCCQKYVWLVDYNRSWKQSVNIKGHMFIFWSLWWVLSIVSLGRSGFTWETGLRRAEPYHD